MKHTLFHRPSRTSRTLMSLGEIPGMRLAWANVSGSIFISFCRASVESEFPLLTAVLLNAKIRAKAAFRAIYFLPMVVAPAAIAMVWKWIFNAEYGIINQIIGSRINWLTNPKLLYL